VISPQFGQGNFVASVSGGIVLWQDVQVGMVIVEAVVSVMVCPFCWVVIGCGGCLYLLCYYGYLRAIQNVNIYATIKA